jgi:hypothetical protein
VTDQPRTAAALAVAARLARIALTSAVAMCGGILGAYIAIYLIIRWG